MSSALCRVYTVPARPPGVTRTTPRQGGGAVRAPICWQNGDLVASGVAQQRRRQRGRPTVTGSGCNGAGREKARHLAPERRQRPSVRFVVTPEGQRPRTWWLNGDLVASGVALQHRRPRGHVIATESPNCWPPGNQPCYWVAERPLRGRAATQNAKPGRNSITALAGAGPRNPSKPNRRTTVPVGLERLKGCAETVSC